MAERCTREGPRAKNANCRRDAVSCPGRPCAAPSAPSCSLAAAAALAPALARRPRARAPPKSTGEAWQIIPLPQSSLVVARDGLAPRRDRRRVADERRDRVAPAVRRPGVRRRRGPALLQPRRRGPRRASPARSRMPSPGTRAARARSRSSSSATCIPISWTGATSRIARKLREQSAAREMEKHYTKAQILEAYLNDIHFGHGWYGVDAASRHYFGHAARRS